MNILNKHPSSFAPLTLLTHLVVGAVGMLAAVQFPLLGSSGTTMVVAASIIVLSFAISRLLLSRTKNALAIIENAVVTGEKTPGHSEFHKAADNLVTHVSRLASVAARGREQSREVEAVLASFDRRGAREVGKSNPSRQLAMLLKSLGADANGTMDRLHALGTDMEHIHRQITDSNELQSELVKAAANEIDQLTQGVDSVNSITKEAKSKDAATTAVAETVSTQLIDFQKQLEKLRDLIVNCETKSLMLRDQTVEISSLMQAIYEHSAKTDTMALNASIESVRAGEHGRGFAAAADEIRKLTGIITDSAQDALDRLHAVEGSVDDTSSICSEGHTTIEEQLNAARDLTQSMSEIRQTNNHSRENLDQVLQNSDDQLQNITAITQVLEELLATTEQTGSRALEVKATRNELNETFNGLAGLLAPLAESSFSTSARPFQRAAPLPAEENGQLHSTATAN